MGTGDWRRNPQLPQMGVYDGVMDPVHDGEHAEHGDHKREGSGRAYPLGDADRLPARRATHRQVGQEGVDLAVRPGREQSFEPLLKLLCAQPPLCRRMPKPFGALLSIGI